MAVESFFSVCLIHVISTVWLKLSQVSLVHASTFLLLEIILDQNTLRFSCGTSLSTFADLFDSLCNFPWFSTILKNIHGFTSQNSQLWKWQQAFPNIICCSVLGTCNLLLVLTPSKLWSISIIVIVFILQIYTEFSSRDINETFRCISQHLLLYQTPQQWLTSLLPFYIQQTYQTNICLSEGRMHNLLCSKEDNLSATHSQISRL